MLGNVKFIGELGRLDLLSEAILHKCIKTLLEKQRDEKYADMSDDLECLCKMMPTIGKKLDQGEAIKLMDQYFERMNKLTSIRNADKTEWALPMRIRFMLQDLIDLRGKQWQPRQTQIDQAPKTMHEVRNGAFLEEMSAAALVASARDAQEAAAQACFNISSLNINSNSALVMNMYHQLSQQPNMSLLNAINSKIATNKNNNAMAAKNKQAAYTTTEYTQHSVAEAMHEEPPKVSPIKDTEVLNLVTRQSTTKQNFIKQLKPNHSDQQANVNPQKSVTNFSFQRSTQRTTGSSSNQSVTDQQKLKANKNQHPQKSFLKNQFIDSEQMQKQPVRKITSSSGNFNWNQPHPSTVVQSAMTNNVATANHQLLQIKTQSMSSSSSPFSSTSSLSASPPLPQDQSGNHQLAPTNQTNQMSSTNYNNKPPTTEPVNNYNNNTYNNNSNNNNNNNNNTNQTRRQAYPQQRVPFYSTNNNSMARNALGVSTNDVLPLNKPIIPLDKVTKYEHNPKNHHNNNIKPKPLLNIFNTNIYNLTPQVATLTNNHKKPPQTNQILDEHVKKTLTNAIDKYLAETAKNEDNNPEFTSTTLTECINQFKTLKLQQGDKLNETIRIVITHSLAMTDTERMSISQLFISLHLPETNELCFMSSEVFIGGLRMVLQNLVNLESEYHCVKSSISMFAARAVCDLIITLDDLGALMRHGAHYPLFFLCMQNIHKLRTKEWLRQQLERSKISLVEMLPASDRHKERLIQILEDRELSFVYPMLRIESALLEKIQASGTTYEELKSWIDANVNGGVTNSNDFIHSLVTCVVKNAAENSVLSLPENFDSDGGELSWKMDKSHVVKQKQLIQRHQRVLQDYLGAVRSAKRARQVEAIYAMQVYANSKGFPKYFLAHLFNQMYDLEIIEEESFLQWKDEINENYPNKGQALFYLQRWFNWLQEASEESSCSETEDLGQKLPKATGNGIQATSDRIEV